MGHTREPVFVRLDDSSEIRDVIVLWQKENLSGTDMLIDLYCFNEKAPKCVLLCPEIFWKIKPRLSNTAEKLECDCSFGTGWALFSLK